MLAKVDVFDSL